MEIPNNNTDFEKLRQEVRDQYADLTDEELRRELDKDEELMQGLQQKTGKTKSEIYNWLSIMG